MLTQNFLVHPIPLHHLLYLSFFGAFSLGNRITKEKSNCWILFQHYRCCFSSLVLAPVLSSFCLYYLCLPLPLLQLSWTRACSFWLTHEQHNLPLMSRLSWLAAARLSYFILTPSANLLLSPLSLNPWLCWYNLIFLICFPLLFSWIKVIIFISIGIWLARLISCHAVEGNRNLVLEVHRDTCSHEKNGKPPVEINRRRAEKECFALNSWPPPRRRPRAWNETTISGNVLRSQQEQERKWIPTGGQ